MKKMSPTRLINKACALSCLLAMFVVPLGASSDEPADGRIVTPGSAIRSVAADELVVQFELITEAGSFAEARQAIDGLRERLEGFEVSGPRAR